MAPFQILIFCPHLLFEESTRIREGWAWSQLWLTERLMAAMWQWHKLGKLLQRGTFLDKFSNHMWWRIFFHYRDIRKRGIEAYQFEPLRHMRPSVWPCLLNYQTIEKVQLLNDFTVKLQKLWSTATHTPTSGARGAILLQHIVAPSRAPRLSGKHYNNSKATACRDSKSDAVHLVNMRMDLDAKTWLQQICCTLSK